MIRYVVIATVHVLCHIVNVDYLPRVGAEVSFVPGEMKACFNVVIIDDEIPENTENFTAVITAVPSGVKIGDPDTTVITIAPDNAVCDNGMTTIYNVLYYGTAVAYYTVCYINMTELMISLFLHFYTQFVQDWMN